MLMVDNLEVTGPSSSQFLSPKFPSTRQSLGIRRSSASLRGISSSQVADDAPNGLQSLAHELAAALMPEPSAGSKLLAEEFGIEFDEEGEGIDAELEPHDNQRGLDEGPLSSDELHPQSFAFENERVSQFSDPTAIPDGEILGSPLSPAKEDLHPPQDAIDVLAQNIVSTDNFLSHLRHLDVDSGPSAKQPTLEKITLEVIRRINETSRDREEQLRALLECEREFRKIAGEVGGSEVLGQLDELTGLEELSDEVKAVAPKPNGRLETLEEESCDTDSDQDHEGFEAGVESPTQTSFPHLPPIDGPPTPSRTIPRLADLRTLTDSLVSSLSTVSEQAQVNKAATTEAGRKLRALKNKLGEWKTDWDSAETSRLKIEKWEAGGDDDASTDEVAQPNTHYSLSRRVDGRKVVEEHLQAFELALAEAALKTKTIMAAS